MISKYIYIILNILSLMIMMLFIHTRMKNDGKPEKPHRNSILLKSQVDEINICLSFFLALFILWRLDTFFSVYGSRLFVKALFSTDVFIISSIIVIALYYIINRNAITTIGVAKVHMFNNFRDVISWEQIVNYHWEENCLIINYIHEDKVDTYLWKHVSSKDRGIIDSILSTYVCM